MVFAGSIKIFKTSTYFLGETYSAIIEYIEDDEDIKNKNEEIEEDIEVEPDSENESVNQQGESKTKGKDPKLSILDNPFQYIKPNKHIKFSSMIYSENPKGQLQIIKYFRRILSAERKSIANDHSSLLICCLRSSGSSCNRVE